MTKTVLILGANGRFGRNAAAAFSWANWNVIRFDRATDALPDAAWGADIIVNAWNPAYPDWAKLVPQLTKQIIDTAKDTGATVLIPGNLYNYGADMPSELNEATQHRPTGPLGEIRETMERAYKDAGVRTIVLRAGDFIDTAPSGNWYDKVITAKLRKGFVDYPDDLDTPHSWAFLHDLADAAVMLAEQADDLPGFFDINFPGYTLTARELHHALEQVTERHLVLRQMPWWPLLAAKPFWPMAKPLLETRYLWNTPHSVKSLRFTDLLPDFAPTPLHDAIAASLQSDVDPDRIVPRLSGASRRPLNLCCPYSKAT
ncbi:dTDP-4-dehydrorhamnose reductase [Litoreibacter halocynthiae]|uniref:dTDP-4-dehydrorhamnose reductase n=1 Tax=Litoreibacter halocynthiae TaxID=1242689 RepID=A0A4V3EWC6_9RHOB|nr:epimerase [Litoreibacter halocynthiae]TDT73675.1 dTDP-4-dehydrorhamnose reductase [Litoreibacter halocynthiae]